MWPWQSDTYKWSIIYRVFRDDFPDVTLACEDGQQIGTHKVILLSSSPLDRKMGINYKVDSTTWAGLGQMESTNVTLVKWNLQMEHYLQSFRDDFLDVTLACEDVQQIGTHKVILLASSPLDRKMGIQLQVNSTTKWTQLQSGLNYKVDLLQSGLNTK